MKKKVLSLVTLFCLLLSLNGCGSKIPHPGTPLVLNEVAHSVFMHLNMLPLRKVILQTKELTLR